MNVTTNLGLKKPEYSDPADIGDMNDNMDSIDTIIGGTALPTTAQTLTGAIAEHETDISGKADKATGATNNNFAALDGSGNLKDSGHKHSDYMLTNQLDDTKGDGDTGYVWSASKTYNEIASKPGLDRTLTSSVSAAPADMVGEIRKGLDAITIKETLEDQAIASFSDGAEGLPLKELTVNVEPVQDLHGYENPWPAGGREE